MSASEGATSPSAEAAEVGRRSRLAQGVIALIYLGIPLIFLALVLWISALNDTGSFNWNAGLIPLVTLAGGGFAWSKHRYKPTRWSNAGMMLGGITALFTSFYSIVLDTSLLAILFMPAAVVGGVLGYLLGRYAERALMVPPVAALADSPYELTFRLRAQPKLRLVIDHEAVSVMERVPTRTAQGSSSRDNKHRYAFAEVTGAHEVTLSGAERLKYPVDLETEQTSSPGPAVILQVRGGDWVLPHDSAYVITQIVSRRAQSA